MCWINTTQQFNCKSSCNTLDFLIVLKRPLILLHFFSFGRGLYDVSLSTPCMSQTQSSHLQSNNSKNIYGVIISCDFVFCENFVMEGRTIIKTCTIWQLFVILYPIYFSPWDHQQLTKQVLKRDKQKETRNPPPPTSNKDEERG